MSTKSRIEETLRSALNPSVLDVIDESHLHAGHHHEGSGHHAGFDGSGETHFRVRVVAPVFAGETRLARHRRVNALLATELAAGVHALAIEASAPGEPTRRG